MRQPFELAVTINSISTTALFDTGAFKTVLSYSFFKRLRNQRQSPIKLEPTNQQLTASNGTPIEIMGSTIIALKIGFQSIDNVQCTVVSSLGYDLIIGCDLILNQLGTVVINSDGVHLMGDQKQLVVIPRQTVNTREQKCIEVCLLLPHKIHLLAGSQQTYTLTAEDLDVIDMPTRHEVVFIAATEQLSNMIQVKVERSQGFVIKVTLTNSTKETMSLPPLLNLGRSQIISNIAAATINSMLIPTFQTQNDMEIIANLTTTLKEQRSQMDIQSDDELQQLHAVLIKFPKVFARNPKCPTQTTRTMHLVETGDSPPIQRKPYPIAHAEEETIRNEIEMLLNHGLIERSNSAWGFPIVMVDKKDGTRRMCIDYRKLNLVTKPSTYPLPLISDLLQQFYGDRYFTSIDLASGYWQIIMDPGSQDKTTFNCKFGSFKWKVMPFGLRNAPATFQALMDEVFGEYKWQFVCVYFDDIVIHSKTFAEHMEHIRIAMECLSNANLQAKLSKCQFLRKELSFVGHLVSCKGISPDPAKIESIRAFPRPKNTHDVRSFVGLCSYYRKFIPQFATIATQLHLLQSKFVKFAWTPSCEKAFIELKKALSTAPVLISPNFNELFFVQTDASDVGIGAVLAQMQDGFDHPVAYASRSLNRQERNYSTTDKECLAVVFAVRQFRQYLLGKKFHLYTDHAALQFIHQMNKSKDMHKRYARYQLELQEFTFDAFHRAGKRNANADALSRHPLGLTSEYLTTEPIIKAYGQQGVINAILTDNEVIRTVKRLQAEDNELNEIKDSLNIPDTAILTNLQKSHRRKFIIKDDLIYKQKFDPATGVNRLEDRLCVPVKMRPELLYLMHGNRYAAHLGTQHTYDLLHHRYYWKNMFHDVQNLVKSCPQCASGRYPKYPTRVIPQPPPPPGYPFEEIGIDVLGDFPVTIPKGNKYIVVIMCKFTKWCECYATSDIISATIAYLIAEEFIPRHGAPRVIYSDRGTNFISHLMEDLYQYINARKITTTPYNPQANGQVERFNHTLCSMLRTFVNQHQTDWDLHLNVCQFAYRIAVNATTKYSPFYLVYGREPRLPVDIMLDNTDKAKNEHDYVVEMIKNVNNSHALARKNILVRRAKLVSELSALFNQTKFAEGSLVYHLVPDSRIGLANKLRCRWKGPMKVIKFLAPSTYILQNINDEEASLIQVSARRIKSYDPASELVQKAHAIMEDTTVMQRVGQSRQPPEFTIEVKSQDDDEEASEHEYYQIDRIINRKLVDKIPHYLVHWKGYGEDANSWVSLADFHDYAIIYKYERKIWQQLRQPKKGTKIITDARRFKRAQSKSKKKQGDDNRNLQAALRTDDLTSNSAENNNNNKNDSTAMVEDNVRKNDYSPADTTRRMTRLMTRK